MEQDSFHQYHLDDKTKTKSLINHSRSFITDCRSHSIHQTPFFLIHSPETNSLPLKVGQIPNWLLMAPGGCLPVANNKFGNFWGQQKNTYLFLVGGSSNYLWAPHVNCFLGLYFFQPFLKSKVTASKGKERNVEGILLMVQESHTTTWDVNNG